MLNNHLPIYIYIYIYILPIFNKSITCVPTCSLLFRASYNRTMKYYERAEEVMLECPIHSPTLHIYSTMDPFSTTQENEEVADLWRAKNISVSIYNSFLHNIYIYKLKPFPQHFGGGHVMEVIRCWCSYLHRHPLQILHSVSWEIGIA